MPNNQQSATKTNSFYLYVVLGAKLFASIQTFALDRLARNALDENSPIHPMIDELLIGNLFHLPILTHSLFARAGSTQFQN